MTIERVKGYVFSARNHGDFRLYGEDQARKNLGITTGNKWIDFELGFTPFDPETREMDLRNIFGNFREGKEGPKLWTIDLEIYRGEIPQEDTNLVLVYTINTRTLPKRKISDGRLERIDFEEPVYFTRESVLRQIEVLNSRDKGIGVLNFKEVK